MTGTALPPRVGHWERITNVDSPLTEFVLYVLFQAIKQLIILQVAAAITSTN